MGHCCQLKDSSCEKTDIICKCGIVVGNKFAKQKVAWVRRKFAIVPDH